MTARIGGRERVTLKRDRAAVVAVNRAALSAGGKLIDVPGGIPEVGRLSLGGDPIHDCPGAAGRERVTLDNESGT